MSSSKIQKFLSTVKNKIKTINKASIAVESREILLDPSLFLDPCP